MYFNSIEEATLCRITLTIFIHRTSCRISERIGQNKGAMKSEFDAIEINGVQLDRQSICSSSRIFLKRIRDVILFRKSYRHVVNIFPCDNIISHYNCKILSQLISRDVR